MEIVIPVKIRLAATVTGVESVLPIVQTEVYYQVGQRVYDPATGFGYTARRYHYSTVSTVPSSQFGALYYWTKDSSSTPNIVVDYLSDYVESYYPPWTYGQAITKGNAFFDKDTNNDYVALQNLTAGENIYPPNVALRSVDATIAGRWYDLGPANLFRLLDQEILTRTSSYATAETVLDAIGSCSRLGICGLTGVSSVDVTIETRELLPNSNFYLSNVAADWSVYPNSTDVTVTHASDAMTVANAASASASGFAYRYIFSLTVGADYKFSAVISGGSGYISVTSGDGTTSLGTAGPASSGTLSVTFTATETTARVDLYLPVGFASMTVSNVSLRPTPPVSMTYSIDLSHDDTFDRFKRVVKISHPTVSYPRYTLTFNQYTGATKHEVGLVMAGEAIELGATHASLVDEYHDYSRVEFDETYGVSAMLQRGFSRRFDCVIQLPSRTGGMAMDVIRGLRATPALYDLSNDGYTEGDVVLHGLVESVRRINTGMPGVDTLSLTLRGLVE